MKERAMIGVSRATSLCVLPIDEFAHQIYLQLNKHSKKIDEIIHFFYSQIRDKNHKNYRNFSEGTIILKALNLVLLFFFILFYFILFYFIFIIIILIFRLSSLLLFIKLLSFLLLLFIISYYLIILIF